MQLDSFSCVFCLSTQEETLEHLFWQCPFAQQCWGILNLSTVQGEGTFVNIMAIKDQLQSQFFMIAIVLMAWTIWQARNDMIFNNNQMHFQQCRESFFKELRLVALRMKVGLSNFFDQLILSL